MARPGPDGLVHMVRDHMAQGHPVVVYRCGLKVQRLLRDPLTGATAWEAEVTCPACTLPSR